MNNIEQKMKEFPITIYSNLEKYDETTSKARARIFYKYENRNGTYISDEFAEKLVKSLPYTPIKGIYDFEEEDFTNHGILRSQGRIYGVVFENPNFAWEKHIDDDGIEREYGCADVLLFTAIYKEASEIVGKSLSMELYDKVLDGFWKVISGQKYFVFTEGAFLGLQALGDDVEPCFEGAAFYELRLNLSEIISKIEQYNSNLDKRQGGTLMFNINFKLSDGQKHSALFKLLNPNFDEEHGWEVSYSICDVYDNYAVAFNYEANQYERVYYTKNDEEDSVVIDKTEVCYIVDVSASEKSALETIQKINNNTYEKIDELFSNLSSQVEELTNSNSEFERKNSEQETLISTLTTERDQINTQYTEATNLLNEAKASLEGAQIQLSELQQQKEALETYKANIELEEKKSVIDSYSTLLSEEILQKYSDSIDNYTALELDKELAYELKTTNIAAFTKNDVNPGYIPKDTPKDGIEEILDRYQNKK